MERWVLTCAVITLSQLGWGCLLTTSSSDHPWLIRIIRNGSSSVNGTGGNGTSQPMTIAHGSLVSPGKVLTAAGIKTVVNDQDVDSKILSLMGYNIEDSCSQLRFVEEITYHWLSQYDYCNLGEFALVTPDDEFVTIGGPFIVSFPYTPPYPTLTEAQVIEEMIGTLNSGNASVSSYMFADKNSDSGDLVDPQGRFQYVSWDACKDMPNFKAIKGVRDPLATEFTFFCGSTIPGKTEAKASTSGMGYDWYMGAPVVFKDADPVGNSTYGMGLYLFWSGQSGDPHVFATFTQYLFDFIEDKIPRSSIPTPPYTWPVTSPPTQLPISLPTGPSLPPQRSVKPHGHAARLCGLSGGWILTVGLFIFSSV